MRRISLQTLALVLATGCSAPDTESDDGPVWSMDGTGGVVATGGVVGTGGTATGGVVGAGGFVATGGVVGAGGFGTGGFGTGGVVGSGGFGTGGDTATGGFGTGGVGTGGDTATGGFASGGTGNTSGTGGVGGGGFGTGGTSSGGTSSGGSSSGGAASGGSSSGGAASGGSSGTGGTATGGSSGTGGSGTGGVASTCNEAQSQVCANQTGTHCGYTYEYWKDQGTGCQTHTADGFNVNWSNINNLLGRKGIRPGNKNNVVTYQADYQPNGNSYLCVYGWTKGPLVEYYIVDSWGSWRPPGGQSVGTVTSDGGTYDLYKTQRVNQPSIEGTKTFDQYWSVRKEKRSSGTITVANHFNAWAAKGWAIGSFYEVSMTVEGYQSSGTASVKMSIK